MKNYYKLLQVDPDASLEVLNQAYRVLVRQCHPDLYHSSQTSVLTSRMQEINEAYTTLSHTDSRQRYDEKWQIWVNKHGDEPFPPPTHKLALRKLLLWALGSYVVLGYFIRPLLSSPSAKIVIFFALLCFVYLIYRRKPSLK